MYFIIFKKDSNAADAGEESVVGWFVEADCEGGKGGCNLSLIKVRKQLPRQS